MVDGQELNGLERWLRMYITHQGGAEEAEVADLVCLAASPDVHILHTFSASSGNGLFSSKNKVATSPNDTFEPCS